MKKEVKKFDLVKISGAMVLLTVLLTWIIPQGTFSGTEMQIGEITRIGIFDFFNSIIFSLNSLIFSTQN